MPLQPIAIPDSIKRLPHTAEAESLIDTTNEAIESYLLGDDPPIENFVTCDFHLLDQAITWIQQNHLLTGDRVCEWGAGFGAAALLAAQRGMTGVGIEIEATLVEQASMLAERLDNSAKFYCGSFVPRGVGRLDSGLDELISEVKNVVTDEDDVYDEIGLDIDDFDLFFAFPWPGEHGFFETVFDAAAADGALLLTYRGRDGMHLVRKV